VLWLDPGGDQHVEEVIAGPVAAWTNPSLSNRLSRPAARRARSASRPAASSQRAAVREVTDDKQRPRLLPCKSSSAACRRVTRTAVLSVFGNARKGRRSGAADQSDDAGHDGRADPGHRCTLQYGDGHRQVPCGHWRMRAIAGVQHKTISVRDSSPW